MKGCVFMCKVIINDVEYEYPEGTSFLKIAEDFQKDYDNKIVLVIKDGKLTELFKKVNHDCRISFLTVASKPGNDAYRRSATLIMMKAFYDVVGRKNIEKIYVQYSISRGYYCTLRGKVKISQEIIDEVKLRMRAIVSENIPINKRTIGTTAAAQMFSRHGMYDKEKLFRYRRVSRTNVYSMAGFEDYYYGYMVKDTSYLRWFDLKPYQDGFVLCLPTRTSPDQIPAFAPEEKLFQVQKASLDWGDSLDIRMVADLNDRVVEGSVKELILTQEAYHEKQIAQIAETIASHPEKKFVMIAGPSSSGKTTFSHRLSTQLSVYGLKPHPIAVDDYFVNRERTPLDENGNYNFECLEAIDAEKFNDDMNRLLSGERVELPTFNFKIGKREYKGKYKQLGPNDILVIEGIHGLNDKLSYSLPRESKFKIYISALTQLNVDEHNRIPTTDGRLLRRIVRDARTRGTSAKNTIAMWPSVRRGEEDHIFPHQESADVMFNSALIYELAVLKIYAEPLLFGVGRDTPEYMEAKRLLKFLDYFVPIPADQIPNNSLVREFIGGSCFDV